MATITADHIASVSLKDADRNPDEFAQKLGRSFEDYGFAIISDHGIPDELIHRAEEKAKAFFALPEETKKSYFIEGGGGARGYTPFGIETAKGAKAHDLKEFWHVGRDLP
jgi:isopenicillin N synthase-like dioxygenase